VAPPAVFSIVDSPPLKFYAFELSSALYTKSLVEKHAECIQRFYAETRRPGPSPSMSNVRWLLCDVKCSWCDYQMVNCSISPIYMVNCSISRSTVWINFCSRSDMNTPASQANQLERRLISFAAVIVSLSSKLPRSVQGRHICSQILRSGTAAAANYGEARGAESRADFIHKLKIVFKELNETTIWLEIIAETSLLSAENIIAIVAENRELCRIIAASIKTARATKDATICDQTRRGFDN
jgi:four helix bundle protein